MLPKSAALFFRPSLPFSEKSLMRYAPQRTGPRPRGAGYLTNVTRDNNVVHWVRHAANSPWVNTPVNMLPQWVHNSYSVAPDNTPETPTPPEVERQRRQPSPIPDLSSDYNEQDVTSDLIDLPVGPLGALSRNIYSSLGNYPTIDLTLPENQYEEALKRRRLAAYVDSDYCYDLWNDAGDAVIGRVDTNMRLFNLYSTPPTRAVAVCEGSLDTGSKVYGMKYVGQAPKGFMN